LSNLVINKDAITVQVSTVGFVSAFSVGGLVINPCHNSLSPDMVEALVCTMDWVAAEWKDNI
jgi:hypothetical protein